MCYVDWVMDLGYIVVSIYMLMYWYGVFILVLVLCVLWVCCMFDLFDSLGVFWCFLVDNCLVFGISVFGGCKYYQFMGCVCYCIYGNNGWWGNCILVNEYFNCFCLCCLIEYYVCIIGLDVCCVDFVKQEFKIKLVFSWCEVWCYVLLVCLCQGLWWCGFE